MDDAELKRRLWEGFAALQTLLGGSARNGWVLRKDGLLASIVPSAPDSPALNAAVALDPEVVLDALPELEVTYGDAGVRRWAVWIDGAARHITTEFRNQGLAVASASPGMGAMIDELGLDLTTADDRPNAGLETVGRVNDLAYGNVDARLERTLTTLEEGTLRGYKAGAAQLLQVLRSVCHSEAHPLGERFDTSRALRQLLDQLNPMFVAHCLRHLGKRGSNRSGSRAA